MHGRLKVKTTTEQEAERQKEKDLKSRQYLSGVTKIFSVRDEPLTDPDCFSLSAQLLIVNPDNLSLWNYRRKFLIALKETQDEASWLASLDNEMKIIEGCLLKNPKSYGAWHHRDWTLWLFPIPPWEKELELCNTYLKLDERNFHCWDHRKIIVNGSKRESSEELKFTQELIERNFSNYSAWHYRSKLLPKVHPPGTNSTLPVEEGVYESEFKRVVTAVFTDPSDQSPWFYLRWLLKKKPPPLRLIKSGVVLESNKIKVILVFSAPIFRAKLADISFQIDGHDINPSLWSPLENDFVWCTSLDFYGDAKELKCFFQEVVSSHHLSSISKPASFNLLGTSNDTILTMPESSLKSLIEIKENCMLLNDLEPGNKWVLLSLIEILSAFNVGDHLQSISMHIEQLKESDPLRSLYYADLWSKIRMEFALAEFEKDSSTTFILTDAKLTRLVGVSRLCCVRKMNLERNLLKKINLECLFCCEELILDQNIELIGNMKLPPHLKRLSLNQCAITNLGQLSFLEQLKSLEKISLRGNYFSSLDSLKDNLCNSYPNIKEIYV